MSARCRLRLALHPATRAAGLPAGLLLAGRLLRRKLLAGWGADTRRGAVRDTLPLLAGLTLVRLPGLTLVGLLARLTLMGLASLLVGLLALLGLASLLAGLLALLGLASLLVGLLALLGLASLLVGLLALLGLASLTGRSFFFLSALAIRLLGFVESESRLQVRKVVILCQSCLLTLGDGTHRRWQPS